MNPDFIGSPDCTTHSSSTSIDRRELQALLTSRERGEVEFTLIDIREEYELIHGMIRGAVNVPMTTFDPEQLAGAVILYCQAGVRSEHLLRELTSQGISGIQHYAGGYLDWVRGAKGDVGQFGTR